MVPPTEVYILGHSFKFVLAHLFMLVHVNIVPSKLIGNVHWGIYSSIGLCKQFHLFLVEINSVYS